MQDNEFNNALNAAMGNNKALGDLMGVAQQHNFVSQDARRSSRIIGEMLQAKGNVENVIISEMGRAYEAVLYIDMVNAKIIVPPNHEYNGQKIAAYQQIAKIVNDATKANNPAPTGNMFSGGATPAAQPQASIFNSSPTNNTASNTIFNAKVNQVSPSNVVDPGGLFGNNQASAPTFASAQQTAVETPQPTFNNTQEPTMETLVCHETEALLRGTCVGAKKINESVALYKETLFEESLLEQIKSTGPTEYRIDLGKRTAIVMTVLNNLRQFDMGNSDVKPAIATLDDHANEWADHIEAMTKGDFSSRMVANITKYTVTLLRQFKTYNEQLRELDDVDLLTLADAARAQSALTTELYRALDNAISFATEGRGFPNPANDGHVNFDLDYSDFCGELEQLETFYTDYNGAQSDVFELLYSELARALSWIVIVVEENIVYIGNREISVEMPYALFDGIDLTPKHSPINRTNSGDSLELIQDVLDVIETKLPTGRVRIIDGLCRSAYLDRAYRTCRPKVSML